MTQVQYKITKNVMILQIKLKKHIYNIIVYK